MTLDLILLGLVLLFAVVGAITGAAKQIAHLVALVVAWFASRTLGPVVAPRLSEAMGGVPLLIGTITGTILLFIAVLVAVRYALTVVLRRLLRGGDPDNRGVDGVLGFLLGGAKVAAIAYVIISGLVFVEQNVVVSGKRLGLSPRDSLAFGLARRFNLFELTQFSATKDLVSVARVARDPEQARRLAEDPAFTSVKKDPRFQRALSDKQLRAALEQGDTRALLRHDAILQLVQDRDFVARLGAAARASQRE
jgi:membrane protein required for colicin V production